MTEQQQRVAIAEACGWKTDKALPDFVNDLNAMHDAWSTLDKRLQILACNKLINAMGGQEPAINAPAKSRAEAFLRTIGKWV